MKKIILFDLDGTLIDSTSAILEAFDVAFLEYNGKRVDHEHVKSLIGNTLDNMFMELGAKKEDVNFIRERYRDVYHGIYLEQTTLLPYAKEAILCAFEFARLGIVTTKTSKTLPELLKQLGVDKYFDTLVGVNDVLNPKPHAEPINLALSRLSATKDERKNTFMIGDTKFDALSAKNANVNALSVLCGYSNYDELKEYNDLIFKNTLEAVEFARDIDKI